MRFVIQTLLTGCVSVRRTELDVGFVQRWVLVEMTLAGVSGGRGNSQYRGESLSELRNR